MKFIIAYPLNGTQTIIDVDNDEKCLPFFDRRIGQEVAADTLGDEWKGYTFKITGGNDKQGFPMKQGILVKGRIKVLMCEGHSTYRIRRAGERKRKTVRGCIVGPDIRALTVTVAQKGEQEVAGLTDTQKPKRLGPKRATALKKLFGIALDKKDTAQESALLRKNVIRRTWQAGDKNRQKAPKIQRLVTADRLRQKTIYKASRKQRWENCRKNLETYNTFLAEFKKKQARKASVEAARRKASSESKEAVKKAPVKQEAPKKAAQPAKQAATKKTTKK